MILSNDKANHAIRLDEKSNVETLLLDQLQAWAGPSSVWRTTGS